MSYTTKELPNLKDLDGNGKIRILPNVPFESFKGKYQVLSSAHVYEDGKLVATWNPGEILDGFGVDVEYDYGNKTKQELRELCIAKELSFKKKATNKELIEVLVNGS